MPAAKPPTLEAVCASAVCLPCAPTLLPRLVVALQKEQGTAQEIESIILLDTALAAATLRLANSAFFSAVAVDTVEDAIIRLGEREIYRLAALALVSRWDTGQMRALRWEPGDFARQTLCRALAAEALAELTGRMEPQSAYTAGLVCGLGKLALAHSGADFYDAVRAHCGLGAGTWEDAEKAVFGFTHADVGARLLRTWRFPELFAVAVEFQATPDKAPAEARCLLGHLSAARYLAASLGPGVGEDAYRGDVHGAFLQEMGFTSEILDAALPVVLERASARLGDNLTNGSVSL
jgi:HD-like signal output (HDOD) protein